MGVIKNLFLSSLSFALKAFWTCFFISFFFVTVFISLRYGSSLTSTEVASWVQAVGSIGAIAGAYAVANWQIASQRLQQQNIEASRLDAMYAVVKCASDHVKSVQGFVKQTPEDFVLRNFWVHLSGPFEASLQALRSLPVHELGHAELVVQCMSIIGYMSNIQTEINVYILAQESGKLDDIYKVLAPQADIAIYSWEKFSSRAGISSELLNY